MGGALTAADVAKWMLEELDRRRDLDQEHAVFEIGRRFGKQFTYPNRNGNPAISSEVLREFEKLTGKDVVWVRSERYWRRRVPHDKPGRMQE